MRENDNPWMELYKLELGVYRWISMYSLALCGWAIRRKWRVEAKIHGEQAKWAW